MAETTDGSRGLFEHNIKYSVDVPVEMDLVHLSNVGLLDKNRRVVVESGHIRQGKYGFQFQAGDVEFFFAFSKVLRILGHNRETVLYENPSLSATPTEVQER
jgi:hypothetical protein